MEYFNARGRDDFSNADRTALPKVSRTPLEVMDAPPRQFREFAVTALENEQTFSARTRLR